MIDKTHDDPSDPLPSLIEQSDSDSETSDCPCPVFVPKEGNFAAQPDEYDESIIPINDPEQVTSNKSFVEFDGAPVAPDSASVVDSYNPDEPDPEHIRQSKQI